MIFARANIIVQNSFLLFENFHWSKLCTHVVARIRSEFSRTIPNIQKFVWCFLNFSGQTSCAICIIAKLRMQMYRESKWLLHVLKSVCVSEYFIGKNPLANWHIEKVSIDSDFARNTPMLLNVLSFQYFLKHLGFNIYCKIALDLP